MWDGGVGNATPTAAYFSLKYDGLLGIVGRFAFCLDAEAQRTDGGLGDVQELLDVGIALPHVDENHEKFMVS